MGRRTYIHTERLSDDTPTRFEYMNLGELRAYCARKDDRGQLGTIYHEELARLEASQSPAKPDIQEDSDDGTT